MAGRNVKEDFYFPFAWPMERRKKLERKHYSFEAVAV
jgi:hypothetical protein